MTKNKTRALAAILAAVLALSLLLTACGKSGDTPTGDNAMPGTSSTPSIAAESLTTAPDNTPSETDTSTSTAQGEIEDLRPPKLDIPYDEESKAGLDENIENFGQYAGIDVSNVIEETYKKYSKYLTGKICEDAITVAIAVSGSSHYRNDDNITGLSDYAIEKVNDFLLSNDEELIDPKDPAQNIAALWLAASLFYDPNYDGEFANEPYFDVAVAFGHARSNLEETDMTCADAFFSRFVSLFGGPFVLAEALK